MGPSGAPGRLSVLSSLVIALVLQPATTWAQTAPSVAPVPPEMQAARQASPVVDAVRDPAAATRAVAGGGTNQLAWRACALPELPTRECAELGVPLNYREPQGAMISLTVGRVPATD